MIDPSSVIYWRSKAPWGNDAQVEQDLILARALIDIFNHPDLSNKLAFRGGTALQKLFYEKPTRYSEDIDLVQITPGPIGPIFDGLREVLEPWLGKSNKKLGKGPATLLYRFQSAAPSAVNMKLKVEINTREHFSIFDLKEVPFSVDSPWFTGKTLIKTYEIEELLGTKLRALFQRRKGRDLYDLAVALRQLPIDVEKILYCFKEYMNNMGLKVSRAQFEQNLWLKKTSDPFRGDITPLLSIENNQHNFDEDFDLVWQRIIAKLPGEPWNNIEMMSEVSIV